MTTLRKELESVGFDFDKGKIIIKETDDCPGWDNMGSGRFIKSTDSLLDNEFDDGYGRPECPAFIAVDEECLYFPRQYDGATGVDKIHKNIDIYLLDDEPTPYPGG